MYRETLGMYMPCLLSNGGTSVALACSTSSWRCQSPEGKVERISHAERPLAKLIGIKKEVIEIAHQVWKLHHESRIPAKKADIGEIQGTKSLYQIGKELRLVKTCMPVATDNAKKAAVRVNGMKLAVSRMLLRANNLAANAAVGVFPSVQVPTEPVVWRRVAQQRMDEAIAQGL